MTHISGPQTKRTELSKNIHATRCLLVSADIANGTKHLSLSRPKVGGALSEATGLHLDTEKGICQEFYYVSCTDPADEFHGIEIRTLLRRCRDSWEQTINHTIFHKLIRGWPNRMSKRAVTAHRLSRNCVKQRAVVQDRSQVALTRDWRMEALVTA
jgi:hypothetical protein